MMSWRLALFSELHAQTGNCTINFELSDSIIHISFRGFSKRQRSGMKYARCDLME